MRIAPLRSGSAPGGAWAPNQVSFRDGRESSTASLSAATKLPDSADLQR